MRQRLSPAPRIHSENGKYSLFCARKPMLTDDTSPPAIEANIQSVLAWLSQINTQHSDNLHEPLLRHLQTLRTSPIPETQRSKLLDIFYYHTECIVQAAFSELQGINLPGSRHLRQRVRSTQQLLEALTQDLLSPASPPSAKTLKRVMQCLAWNLRISHLLAAHPPAGLWLQLHSTLLSAQQLSIAGQLISAGQRSPQNIYLQTLLTAIAQPASFNSPELEFISEFLEHAEHKIQLLEASPADCRGVFWIDPKTDFPAHAMVRRSPPVDSKVWFFSCKEFAQEINEKLKALQKGSKASTLKLPEYANSAAGQSVLQRISRQWGTPGKRKFQRRRQSYRALLCSGMEHLWQLFQYPEKQPEVSEWMVTNESPDGYAIMHVAGPSGRVQIGEIVAIQVSTEHSSAASNWPVCLVRWVVSENPEHLEFGLQVIATEALSTRIVQTGKIAAGMTSALLLPEKPPLRASTAVVVKNGALQRDCGKLIALLEKGNLAIRELRPVRQEEETSRIEILNVEPDETS
jgi:hypothetical protein